MSSIYERIAEQVKKVNMNGKQLGAVLGLKKSPLTDWKNHKSSPTLEQILKMCEIFAISSDYLLFGFNETLEPDQNELLRNYNSLDSRGKHRVHTVIYEELDRIDAQAEEGEKKNVG